MKQLLAALIFLFPLAGFATTADVTASWSAASGPVDHYALEVSIDSGAWVQIASTPANTPSAKFTANVGSTVKARVRAFKSDVTVWTISPESDLLTVVDPTPLGTPGKPALIIIQITQ